MRRGASRAEVKTAASKLILEATGAQDISSTAEAHSEQANAGVNEDLRRVS
jgi:hypothetical protein